MKFLIFPSHDIARRRHIQLYFLFNAGDLLYIFQARFSVLTGNINALSQFTIEKSNFTVQKQNRNVTVAKEPCLCYLNPSLVSRRLLFELILQWIYIYKTLGLEKHSESVYIIFINWYKVTYKFFVTSDFGQSIY